MDDSDVIEGNFGGNKTSGPGSKVLDAPVEVLPPDGSGPAPDNVKPKRGKRGGANLGRVNQAKQLRALDLSMQLKELVCEHGYSLGRAAKELGITRRWASKVWAVWVERLRRATEGTDDEIKKGVGDVRVYVDHHARAIVERCTAMLDLSPAYAAGALRGLELLAKLNRLNLDAPPNDPNTGAKDNADAILRGAQERAGKQLGLAVPVEAMVAAEEEAAATGVGKGLAADLTHIGA